MLLRFFNLELGWIFRGGVGGLGIYCYICNVEYADVGPAGVAEATENKKYNLFKMKKFLLIAAILVSGAFVASEAVYASPAAVRQEVSMSEPTLKTRPGVIEVSCPADGRTYTFQVYSITGQLVKKFVVSESSLAIEVPQGCYIIKCESWTKKAVVG